MLAQIVVGSVLIALTVIVEAAFIGIAIAALRRFGAKIVTGRRIVKLIAFITGMTLWMVAALTIAVWLWAAAFLLLGLFPTLEEAVYFSAVSFTTLGFGDVLLDKPWRLLSGFIAANGLILFSLTTAFLIEAVRGVHRDYG
ncbi:two pore domain potassium channel family protein [Parasphingopyxis algicola]|uniref:ion channel n=1 Tax=Parasphingopyxis algicola TaxID=2026624 RepID=UPI0015A3109E|nr:ion channel [Parasphingopyxis algicola]QLC23836.1 two pore domain potassium channel family protein [Parasphingopyxis algicola]